MTLIQTLFTNEFIIQVSDRRLTKGISSSRSILIDDENFTKLICWNDSFTVGFTGIARIDRRGKESTAVWIAKTLSDHPLFEAGLGALHRDAEKRLKSLPKNWDRRLAIHVAGFDERKVPLVAVISNFDPATNISKDPTKFEGSLKRIAPGHRVASMTAGAVLDDLQLRLLTRYVPKILREPTEHNINRAIKLMVKNQRLVAEKNHTVGEDALCVFIPLSRQGPAALVSNLGAPEMPIGTTSYGFFDKRGWQFEQRGPLAAHNGFVIENWASADPEKPDYQSISMRMLKVPPSWGQEVKPLAQPR